MQTHLGHCDWELRGCLGCLLQVAAFRKRLEKVVGDKHEEVMGRMGAIMATGLAMGLLLSACTCAHGCFG